MNMNIVKLFAIVVMCFMIGAALVACGSEGPQGPQGPQGEVGPQGPAGANGADGEDGEDLTCGDSAHNWAETGLVFAKHTVDSEGIVLYPCVDCGVLKAVVEGHKYDTLVETIAPTCTEAGYTTYSCRCGATENRDDTDALGHTWGEWEESLYSSSYVGCACEKETLQVRHCTVCEVQDDKTNTIPAPGHVYTTWTPTIDESNTESPCLQLPLEAAACDNCDHKECHAVRPVEGATAEGHHFGDWYIVTEPTADAEGTIRRECAVCALSHPAVGVENGTIPALNETDYTYDVTTAPTCVDAGEATYTIVVGEDTLVVTVALEALGHDYTNGVYEITKKPTYATSEEEFLSGDCNGSVNVTCDVCKAVATFELPALGGALTGRFIVAFGDCLNPKDSYSMPLDADGYLVNVEFEQTNPAYTHDEAPAEDSAYTILKGEEKWYKAYWCEKCSHWIIVESYDEDPTVELQ